MFEKLKPALMVTRRELIDQMRDWRIITPILVLTLIFPAIMNFTAERMVNFVNKYGAGIIAERLIPFLLMVVGFFPISVSLVIALESFAGEKERGSIEPLLTSPLEDWQLYLGKLIAVMIPPLMAAYLGITIYLIGVYRELGWTAEPFFLLQMLVLTFVQALVMVSGAVVVSTQTTSVRAANLLASFIIIPIAFLIQGESVVMFWGEYSALWWAVLGLGLIAALLIRTGVGHFNREELLGHDIDALNFKGSFNILKDEFIGNARSIGQWWRKEVGASLKQMLMPFLFMLLMLVGAYLVGSDLTNQFVIPPGIIDLSRLDSHLVEGFDAVRFFSTEGIPIIWFHNIRAIVIALVLGVFSYSVLGILVIMLPFFLIGFFTTTFVSAGIPAWQFLGAFVLPHGIIEIPAILLAGAAIFRLGANMAAPSLGKSIGEGVLRSFADWAKIMVGVVIPMLLLAAILEALVTPEVAVWLFAQ